MNYFRPAVLSAVVLLAAQPALAEDKGVWSGEIEAGVAIKTGNTKSTDAQVKLRAGFSQEFWSHRLRLEALRQTESGDKTAESYLGQFQSNYTFSEHDYVFGVARGERDKFSGYDYQTSFALGYGRHLWVSELGTFDVEIGPGVRRSKLDTGEKETEVIGRLFADLKVNISSNAKFGQEVTVLTGSDNTEIESITALTTGLTDALALRLSFTVKHNTSVPADTKNTDTHTSASVVYRF